MAAVAQQTAKTAAATPRSTGTGRNRILGLDVLRGLAIVGMLFVDNRGSSQINPQWIHESWDGLHVADLVFPIFLFAVGASMPMSARANRPRAVLSRFIKLALLGILIVLVKDGWGVIGGGVLAHIAFAYLICWLIIRSGPRLQYVLAAAILLAVTLLYLFLPVPGSGATGFGMSSNWGIRIDDAIGVGFSAENPHAFPTSAVSIFIGVIAGRALVAGGRRMIRRLVSLGAGTGVAGALLMIIVPLNKNLWTPSYVLVTSAIAIALLIVCYVVVDHLRIVWPFRPLLHIGSNAIVAFCLSEILYQSILTHWREQIFGWIASWSSTTWATYLYPISSLVVIWAICYLLHRRHIIVRI